MMAWLSYIAINQHQYLFSMKTALIVGGTGMTGKQLIALLLADSRYSKLILLVRKPIDLKHEKLEQVAFNFEYPNRSVVVADEIFCCLGTTIRAAGSKEAFYKVDHEYVSLIARIGFENGVKKFALVSAMGANKNSALYYNKVKGLIEESVCQTGFGSCYIFRPSLLLGQRNEFRLGEKIATFFMTAFSFAIPKKYKAIDAKQVAKAMIIAMNFEKNGLQIFESGEIAEM